VQKLFRNAKRGQVLAATAVPFKTEDEFERYVLNAKEILSGIVILKRQVRAGRDIPDLVGIDQDNNAVIIENKNQPVDEEVLPQLLRYAIWAETHQDTIKTWWLEAKDRSDDIGDIEMDWDRLQIRLIVLAPSIKPTVPRLLTKLGYPVDLVEITRFMIGADEFVLVSQLETPDDEGRGTSKGMRVYDRKFYEEQYNPQSAGAFLDMVATFEKLVKTAGWSLERKYNAYYAGFKHGFFNVFGVHWIGTKSFEVFVTIPKDKSRRAIKLCPYPAEYDPSGKSLTIRVTDNVKPKRLLPLLQFAHDSLIGQHPAKS